MIDFTNICSDSPIGIFDSGIGGLTVVTEIIKQLPNEKFIYVGDEIHFPYGEKSQIEIRDYSFEICNWLVKQGVKLIVIACNTATAAALDYVKDKISVPVVGVVNGGVKAAVNATKNNCIGVLATQACVDSGLYQNTLKGINPLINVVPVACPKFVRIVEEDLKNTLENPSNEFKLATEEYFPPIIDNNCDTVILGCTHFPALTSLLEKSLPDDIKLISPSKITVEDIKEILYKNDIFCDSCIEKNWSDKYSFFTTGSNINLFENFASILLKQKVKVKKICV